MMKVRLWAIVCLVSLSSQGQAERYSTWVDETGQLQVERVREAENPLLKRAEAVAKEAEKSSIAPAKPVIGSESAQLPDEQLRSIQESEALVDEKPADTVKPQSASEVVQDAKIVEFSERAQQVVVKDGVQPSVTNPINPTSATTVNPEDYMDAEELAKRGYRRESEDGAFYTWVDANGVIYNSPYPPAQEEPSKPAKLIPTFDEVEFAPGMRVERRIALVAHNENQADPAARQLFRLDDPDSSLVGSFARDCCLMLPNHAVGKLHPEDGYLVEFDARLEGYSFSTGQSVYQLVRLPEKKQDYVLQLRSFLNRTLFYPTLVFLDDNMEPQRLVSHILYEFEPENWFRHGYLEGRVPVEASKGERYVLVITTAEDLKLISKVPGKKRERDVVHSQQGLVHLAILETR